MKAAITTIWDNRARLYDTFEASALRRGPAKETLFRKMKGKVLFIAVGTGMDIRHFPLRREIVAIDISVEMLRRAAPRAQKYPGQIQLVRTDALRLGFADESFDTVATSCTLCSVPDPQQALQEIYRVLRPGGTLLMFEHVRSRNLILALTLDLMTLFTRRRGTEMNRRTIETALAAGFHLTHVEPVFLDIILAVQAEKLRESERGQ
jgi:ubiquinone/menaquinone biosynthesis C-methylase UbiE